MNQTEGIMFSLDINNIKKIPFEKYEKNFTFIVDGKKYLTSRIIADILSPTIQKYHFIDETIDTFHITTQNKNPNFDFSTILSLTSFEQVKVSKNQIQTFIDIFSSLNNQDELIKFLFYDSSPITLSNVFDRIHKKQYIAQLNSRSDINNKIIKQAFDEKIIIQNEINFISSNFSVIDKNQIKKLGDDVIENIINNEKLQLNDEDSLLQFVIEIYKKDHQKSFLFEYIEFSNVSKDELLNFFQVFDINNINQKIWNSLIERAFQIEKNEKNHINTNKSNRYKKNPLFFSFPYSEGNEFNGIIKYLTEKTGGNIHDNGTINVSSNSIFGPKAHPKNLLDFNDISSYHSNDQSNIWICFDFKNMEVEIDHYSIESYYSPADYGGHMKNWTIEISNDTNNWIQIDKRSNCSSLNGNRKIRTFDVKPNHYSRYVRICHTGTCWDNYKTDNCTIFFHCIEFYGNLKIN